MSIAETASGLDHRDRRPEWMDRPDLAPAAHARALRGLARINRLSRTASILWPSIASLRPEQSGGSLRLLDLACGGGDVPIRLLRRAVRSDFPLVVHGCDASEVAVDHARHAAARLNLEAEFFRLDVLRDPLPRGYDVLTCSLFLHHLDEAQAVEVLRRMGEAARRLVLVDDLIRSRTGYALAWLGCRMLSRSPIVHHDGPVSVASAFTPAELGELALRAGLVGARITRHWPERQLLAWCPP